MIRINLYKKDKIDMNLLIGSYLKERWNMPFYNTNIELWKGVDNTIEFSIRNHDRKAEILPATSKLVFKAINNKLQQVIDKDIDVVNANLGRYSVTITKDELNDYDDGIFVGHVSVIDENGKEDLLYSGVDWIPNFDVEVKPNKLDLIEESVKLSGDTFNREIYQDPKTGKQMERFTSSVMKSDVTEYHTFLAKLKDFIGTIKFQGSCVDTPNHGDSDWFDIDIKEYKLEDDMDFESYSDFEEEKHCCKHRKDVLNEIPDELLNDLSDEMLDDLLKDYECDCCCKDDGTTYVDEPFNGTITETYKLNCLWVRVQYIREYEDPATIDEIYYRN